MTNAEIVIWVFMGLFLITTVGCLIYVLFYGREDKGVECDDCGVYVSKHKAQKIPYANGVVYYYYCKGCTKKYDSVGLDTGSFKTRYYRTDRFEVDNNGKRIGIMK